MNTRTFVLIVIFGIAAVLLFFLLRQLQVTEPVSPQPGQPAAEVPSPSTSYTETFTDLASGLSFTYPAGETGYVMDDVTVAARGEYEMATVVKAYQLMGAAERAELAASDVGREAPPSMRVVVFENTDMQSASQWVDAFPEYTNLALALGPVDRDAVVGGANAVRYRTDGLYVAENVVVAHGGYVYFLTGSFMDEADAIRRDFVSLVDSVNFIPGSNAATNGAGQKIDPQVACESALAYMQFPNGAAADAFVEACVAGEHPEVIQRYIESLDVSDEVAL